MVFNLANILTLGRIFLVPVIVLLLAYPGRMTCMTALIFFAAASLTDLADGFVARRYNQITTLGKFLDPIADKILVSSVLISLVGLGWVPAWAAVIIVVREILVTGLRAVAAQQGLVIAADAYGKIKTVFQMLSIGPLILHYPVFGIDPNPLGLTMLYISLVMTVYSGGNYFLNFYKIWTK
ncbi:MAG: CDP-diacylglycerol--glycerol-3-phosphate 3-phosphatidyltransferase [Deltaproteobacteria bacterium]|nr:CDP-diacylglycerol--glycerol-3-phosphate 3-phosphatidyltransferase [Deltaproteobacteria bacterium]